MNPLIPFQTSNPNLQMEVLYAKLYSKYTNLKKEKESEFDELNRDQEVKFSKYADAADEIIEHLKSENEKLNGQVDELKNELASIRSSSEEQTVHYQKLLTEENQKNEELSKEIKRLQKLQDNVCSKSMHEEVVRGHDNSHDDTPAEETHDGSAIKSTKKRKLVRSTEDRATSSADVELDLQADQHIMVQPACCQRKINGSGGDVAGTSSVNCVFQYLVEFVVGMKVSPLTQSNELCILVHHQSSGYSFSLTWITNSKGEVELLYRVLSLGTFERVAPEWMKETLVFSTSMCSVFFERVSRVIKS
ncbi:hypothetical protein ACP275_09G004200 [Erythranthe tilingii]